jgi:hypothetical protein
MAAACRRHAAWRVRSDISRLKEPLNKFFDKAPLSAVEGHDRNQQVRCFPNGEYQAGTATRRDGKMTGRWQDQL